MAGKSKVKDAGFRLNGGGVMARRKETKEWSEAEARARYEETIRRLRKLLGTKLNKTSS